MWVLIQKIMPQKWTIKLQINLWPSLKPTEALLTHTVNELCSWQYKKYHNKTGYYIHMCPVRG